MTDDPDLTPTQEREVRRLLADARHTQPMPGDVAARLDRVLAELARGDSEGSTPLTTLASRRRQRVTTLLVAAAAVVAVGIGLGQVIGTGAGSDSAVDRDAPAAASSAESGNDRDADSLRRHQQDSGKAASAPAYAVAKPLRIRPDAFSTDVTKVQRVALDGALGNLSAQGESTTASGDYFDCTPAEWGAGTFVPVTYGGDAGVLVFRRADGDTQVVDLFQCGSPDVLRSITLPAP
jgi:hypothetical protein